MDEKSKKISKSTKLNNVKSKVKKEESKKDEFDVILDKIKKMSEALELHTDVKKAVESNQVDNSYLKYIDNSLEDKFFCDAKFDKIKSKVLLEEVCPYLANIENFEIKKLLIDDIGSHFEENENYIDKICTYDGKFICLFGISEENPEKVIKYESRKFTRVDIIEAIKTEYKSDDNIKIYQYDEYYIVEKDENFKVYSERKVIALSIKEETIFDKIKSKFQNIFNTNPFSKKKYLPIINLVYDNNPNRLDDFKIKSKINAKKRMKVLLKNEREITRDANI